MKQSSKKTDFHPFKIGTVFNPLRGRLGKINQSNTSIRLLYPSRLEAMAIDPSKIANNNNLVYSPGQIDFSVGLFKEVTVRKNQQLGSIKITKNSSRHSLIKHAVELMRQALHVKDGLNIEVKEEIVLRHCGLGSSSGLIASVACAINELYGNPISDKDIVSYLAQNHGEEIDGSEQYINPVQSIGGSAACGTHAGGLIIIAGQNKVVATMDIPPSYKVVIGIPKEFKYPDSKYLLDKEIENMQKFVRTGKKFASTIAYRLFHEVLPELTENKLAALGELIYDYRFNMGSIENCSFVYPPIVEIAKKISILKKSKKADILALSSVGPGFFAVTLDPKACERVFQENNMLTILTNIHNGRYEVVGKD